MAEMWSATLNPASPRYADWKAILDSDHVTLLSPMPGKTKLGDEECEVYLLDWQDLDEEASLRLLNFVAKKFNASVDEISADLDRDGHFPIRASDVIVSMSLRMFL
jgi:hypothetical protein